MRILNINSYYYSSTVHKELQLALHSSNIESNTYVPVYKGYSPRAECNYIDEKWVKKAECFNKIDRFIFYIKHKKILNNIVNEMNLKEYQAIHAHSLFSNGYIAFKLKEQYNIPYVVAVRDTDVNVFFKKMLHLRRLGNEILINADAIIFLSQPYMDLVVDKFVIDKYKKEILRKSHVIPNGIDEFWLNNRLQTKRNCNPNSINLLHVGALSKRKNITKTIRASEILIKKGYNIRFTAVGKIANDNIYQEFKKKKFTKYITQLPKEELINVYRNNDVLVVPSKTETFGLVYPEAMSQGLPVIYTKGQGFDGQFAEGEVGYGVNSFNASEIGEKIIEVMNHYNEISQRCVKACQKFNWKNISKQYQEIYLDLIEQMS